MYLIELHLYLHIQTAIAPSGGLASSAATGEMGVIGHFADIASAGLIGRQAHVSTSISISGALVGDCEGDS